MFKLVFIILSMLIFTNCSAYNSIIKGDDGVKSPVYLVRVGEQIHRVEKNPKRNFLMTQKGPVQVTCAKKKCTDFELIRPDKELLELSKEGIWVIYGIKEKEGQSEVNDKDKVFYSYKKAEGQYIKNLKEGKWTEFSEKNKILKSSNFVGGKKNGEELRYGPDGPPQLVEKLNYVEDKRDGEYFEYTLKGLNKEKGTYKDDKRMGIWNVFYMLDEKGKMYTSENPIKEELECKDDLRNGKYKKFYHNKVTAEEATFVEGRRNGEAKFYFPQGQLSSIGKYEPLPPVPPKAKVENETEEAFQSRLEKYKKDYNESLFQCGEIEEGSKGVKVHQKIGEWKDFYPSGQVFAVGKMVGGQKVGDWTYYSSTGVIRAIGKMTNESIMDEGKIFTQSGELEGEGKFMLSVLKMDETKKDKNSESVFEFKHTYKEGIPFKYYEKGKLSMELKNDPATGDTIAIKYDENGELIGSGPAANKKENGCWTMKAGNKKFFIMGKENPTMGKMVNCK